MKVKILFVIMLFMLTQIITSYNQTEGHLMKDNFRPVHLRHGRIITCKKL